MLISLYLVTASLGMPHLVASDGEALKTGFVLPSGTSDAFRRRMLDWDRPAEVRPRLQSAIQSPRNIRLRRVGMFQVSSKFGWRVDPITGEKSLHAGIDLPSRIGSPVLATAAGTVRVATWVRGYGNLIEIEHSGGVRTLYGHLSRVDVYPSEHVTRGQIIGKVGSTGRSTGPHLHYEMRVHGVAVNPLPWIGRF